MRSYKNGKIIWIFFEKMENYGKPSLSCKLLSFTQSRTREFENLNFNNLKKFNTTELVLKLKTP